MGNSQSLGESVGNWQGSMAVKSNFDPSFNGKIGFWVTLILGLILGVSLILTPSIRQSILSTDNENKSSKSKENKTVRLLIIILIYILIVIVLAFGISYLFTFVASMQLSSAKSYCQATNTNDINNCINMRLQTEQIESQIALNQMN